MIGVPKTIDNDLAATDTTFGFDTAVSTAVEAIDRLKTTAESHSRIIVVEAMGRYAGFLALSMGIGGAADAILELLMWLLNNWKSLLVLKPELQFSVMYNVEVHLRLMTEFYLHVMVHMLLNFLCKVNSEIW